MSAKPETNCVFYDLLEFGYLPKELPPIFTSAGFGRIISKNPERLKGFKAFSSSSIRFDYFTHLEKGRMLGVIHPINYALLSEHISNRWDDIQEHLTKSNQSIFPVVHDIGSRSGRRAIKSSSFTEREIRLTKLRSEYPMVVQLDINRFYGSIYTHSLPWALLGKKDALALHASKSLESTWWGELDRLARSCENNQTIGLPIGPDTSRILSEIILARIDLNLSDECDTSFFHLIDDYYFGAPTREACDKITAIFEKCIRDFELRSRDDKTALLLPVDNVSEDWEWKILALDHLSGPEKVRKIFDIVFEAIKTRSTANVLAYMLRKYGKVLSKFSHRDEVLRCLQRALFAAPHLIIWVAPFLVGLQGGRALAAEQLNVLKFGLSESARKHDIVSMLWYLYLRLAFKSEVEDTEYSACLDMDCVLVDLVLAHAIELGLVGADCSSLKSRHSDMGLDSKSWMFIYETRLRGWKAAPSGDYIEKKSNKPRGTSEPSSFFKFLKAEGGSFYNADAFDLASFNWGLSGQDFAASDDERIRYSLGLSEETIPIPRSTCSQAKRSPAETRKEQGVRTSPLEKNDETQSAPQVHKLRLTAFDKLKEFRRISDLQVDPYSEY